VLGEANVNSPTGLSWFLVMTVLHLITGFLLFVGAVAFLTKRDSTAITTGVLAMVISLTFINTLSFYLNQFSTLLTSIYSFVVLLVLQRYRDRYLGAKSDSS
jgi:hypothetical protein